MSFIQYHQLIDPAKINIKFCSIKAAKCTLTVERSPIDALQSGNSTSNKTPDHLYFPLYTKNEIINLISSIPNQGTVCFMIYNGAMNSQTLIRFCEWPIKDAGKKIYWILDRLRLNHRQLAKTCPDNIKTNSSSAYTIVLTETKLRSTCQQPRTNQY